MSSKQILSNTPFARHACQTANSHNSCCFEFKLFCLWHMYCSYCRAFPILKQAMHMVKLYTNLTYFVKESSLLFLQSNSVLKYKYQIFTKSISSCFLRFTSTCFDDASKFVFLMSSKPSKNYLDSEDFVPLIQVILS
jgi:hypothetical protein